MVGRMVADSLERREKMLGETERASKKSFSTMIREFSLFWILIDSFGFLLIRLDSY